ncbi:MAG: hypothetical protein QNJ54_29680 [Prochloraceae cyanobacterium]|nr:hypothetical protein [Prochloraceae cyanobacterium]
MEKSSQRPKAILMIPIRRCGSHALRLRLNFSPDFYSPYPLHIVDFMPLVELYGDLQDDWTYFQLVIDLIGLQNVTMVKWDRVALDPVAIFEALRERPRSVHSVAWEMLFQAGEELGIICIVLALFLSILGIYANRYIRSKRAVFFFLLIFSSAMIIFSGSRFIELWNLNLVIST